MSDGDLQRPTFGDLETELLAWTETGQVQAPLPPRGPLLGFEDPRLERAYLRAEHVNGRRYFAISLTILGVLVASILWLDPWLLPAQLVPTFRAARLYVLLPAVMLLALNALWIRNPLVWIRQSAALTVIFGLAHPLLLLKGGAQVFEYLEIGILETILAATLVLGLPLRWSGPIIGLFGLTFGAATVFVEPDISYLINFAIDFAIYGCLGIAASYRHEDTARREFIAQARSRKQYAQRLAADADRRRWLEVIAAFLRHELKNSMIAISTSIELADRAAPESKAGKYLARGRRSVEYMQLLLSKVADATNLESALAQHRFEPLDLSSLVANYLEDLQIDTPTRAFKLDVESGVEVSGHPDSLIQMLEKLLNNALEHGSHEHPICVALSSQAGYCHLTVADIGDALPEDTLQIFEPFVTRKALRSGAAHLGLGLFVAQAIVKNHGGTLRVEALADPPGARFTVELPLAREANSSRDPSVAPAALSTDPVEAPIDP